MRIGLAFLVIGLLVQGAHAAPRNWMAKDGKMVIEAQRETPITHRADVVVVGAGMGGCMAAVAAARQGADTLLIEQSGVVGGNLRQALGVVVGISAPGWQPTLREGLLRDFADYLVRTGEFWYEPLTLEQVLERGDIGLAHNEVASGAMLAMLHDAGARMLFHARCVDAVVEEGALKAVIVETRQGRLAIAGKAFVDGTGLGDVAAQAGAPMVREEPYMGVQAIISGVDEPRFKRWCEENSQPLDDSYRAWVEGLLGGRIEDQPRPWAKWWTQQLNGVRMPQAVMRLMRDAAAKGELTLWHRRGEARLAVAEGLKTNTGVARPRTYITGLDPFNVDDVSWAEVTSRLLLFELQRFLRAYIPGFENSVMDRLGDTVSERAGRYITIDNAPTQEEIERGAKNADCIYVYGRGEKAGRYEVPYRVLLPQRVEGLLVVSKATGGGINLRTRHGIFLQGQAAGIAAAMAAKQGIAARQVDIHRLQSALKAAGVEIPY